MILCIETIYILSTSLPILILADMRFKYKLDVLSYPYRQYGGQKGIQIKKEPLLIPGINPCYPISFIKIPWTSLS